MREINQGLGQRIMGLRIWGLGRLILERRPERQGNSPVRVKEHSRLREQQGQRPQDRSESAGVRTRRARRLGHRGEALPGLPTVGPPLSGGLVHMRPARSMRCMSSTDTSSVDMSRICPLSLGLTFLLLLPPQ